MGIFAMDNFKKVFKIELGDIKMVKAQEFIFIKNN